MISKDHCVYVKRTTGEVLFLTFYVDDILIAENKFKMINATKQWLSSVFELKDIGKVRYILSVKMVRNHLKKLLGMYQEA